MLTEQEIRQMYNEHSNGSSIRKIARDKNLHRAIIERNFKKYNLPTIKKNDIYNSISNKLISLYIAGKSINEISSILDIPATSIYRILKSNNVNFRKVSFYRDKITT